MSNTETDTGTHTFIHTCYLVSACRARVLQIWACCGCLNFNAVPILGPLSTQPDLHVGRMSPPQAFSSRLTFDTLNPIQGWRLGEAQNQGYHVLMGFLCFLRVSQLGSGMWDFLCRLAILGGWASYLYHDLGVKLGQKMDEDGGPCCPGFQQGAHSGQNPAGV